MNLVSTLILNYKWLLYVSHSMTSIHWNKCSIWLETDRHFCFPAKTLLSRLTYAFSDVLVGWCASNFDNKDDVRCIRYVPSQQVICCGFANGLVDAMNSDKGEYVTTLVTAAPHSTPLNHSRALWINVTLLFATFLNTCRRTTRSYWYASTQMDTSRYGI